MATDSKFVDPESSVFNLLDNKPQYLAKIFQKFLTAELSEFNFIPKLLEHKPFCLAITFVKFIV